MEFDTRRRRRQAVQRGRKLPGVSAAAAAAATRVKLWPRCSVGSRESGSCKVQQVQEMFRTADVKTNKQTKAENLGHACTSSSPPHPSEELSAECWFLFSFCGLRGCRVSSTLPPLYSSTLFICFFGGGRWPSSFQRSRNGPEKKRLLEVSHKLVLISLLNNQLEQRGFAACFPN